MVTVVDKVIKRVRNKVDNLDKKSCFIVYG